MSFLTDAVLPLPIRGAQYGDQLRSDAQAQVRDAIGIPRTPSRRGAPLSHAPSALSHQEHVDYQRVFRRNSRGDWVQDCCAQGVPESGVLLFDDRTACGEASRFRAANSQEKRRKEKSWRKRLCCSPLEVLSASVTCSRTRVDCMAEEGLGRRRGGFDSTLKSDAACGVRATREIRFWLCRGCCQKMSCRGWLYVLEIRIQGRSIIAYTSCTWPEGKGTTASTHHGIVQRCECKRRAACINKCHQVSRTKFPNIFQRTESSR